MKKIGVLLTVIFVLVACLAGGWWYYNQQNSITVVFSEAKGLKIGAPVRMSGVDIGEVRDITVSSDGVDVRLLIDRSARKLLSTTSLFVIDSSSDKLNRPLVLVKDGGPKGDLLGLHARVRGMDSSTLWRLSDFSKQVSRILAEPPVRDFMEKLQKVQADMNRAINNMDKEAMLAQVSETINRLSDKCDQVIQEVGAKDRLEKISHSITKIKSALARAGNSKEADEVRKSLDRLAAKVREELAKQP